MMIQIRTAIEADAQSLVKLNQAFNGVCRRSDEVRSALRTGRSSETVLVAEESGDVVGFVCFQTLHSVCYDSPWTEITELYVTPTRRRRGTGKALVCEAIRQAKESGVSEILLRTNVKNDAAKKLFSQVGLEIAPHMVFHSSMEAAQPAAGADPGNPVQCSAGKSCEPLKQ